MSTFAPVVRRQSCCGGLSTLVGLALAAMPACALAQPHTEAPKIDKPLIAYWDFDEAAGNICGDRSGQSNDAQAAGVKGMARTAAGVFGGAVEFSGKHRIECSKTIGVGAATRLSLSVWVQPTAFDRYNEIFRKEDGDRRVLFSFQEHGKVLSLGLNVGGYVECDAKLDPKTLLDGLWHHCAATFDNKVLRVYLDGAEIGNLERPGRLAAGGDASGCIGSLAGSECFQGAMDELRIYADALTADELARLYRQGVESLARSDEPAQKALDDVYLAHKEFAETLAATRRALVAREIAVDARTARLFGQRLRAAFPNECGQFRAWTGADPVAYLRCRDDEFHRQTVGRLLDLLLEYRPLTPAQHEKQSADERNRVTEAEQIERRFAALLSQRAAAQFSPEWIRLIFEAGQRVVWRPYEREAVAPYVTPRTPETRTLTVDEAHAALRRDWLFQADEKPTRARVDRELARARALMERMPEADWGSERSALADVERSSLSDAELYLAVRAVKRRIMFRNPVVDFQRVVFVDMPLPQGSEFNHETRHRLGYMAVPGGRLLTLDGLGPDGKLMQLMPQSPLHGSFWRPDVSFDGGRIVFCFKPHNEKSFHLYEIDADGRGLRQLTDGPFDDLDPLYLPDGNLLFSTTRGHTYVRCMPPTNAFVLARCDADGRRIYLVSANNEPDYLPSLLNDGRVIYTRWEYTDKPVWRGQKLWTINPDGTQVAMFWGNQSVWPDVTKDVRTIPGSRRVMFTGCGHHNWFAGCIGIVDPDRGRDFPHGLTKVTAELPWPEVGDGPGSAIESPRYEPGGRFTAYYSPYPLGECDFLVSACRNGKFVLYLMDVDGNRELIYEGAHHIFHAMPLKSRPRPPVIPSRVAWPTAAERDAPQPGAIFSHNVYEGAPSELRGKARHLRVLTIDHKTYTYWNKRPYVSTGPVVSGVQSEGVKRIIGTVPIEADGSVSFAAPAGLPLHFQLLDENQRAVQTMRSFVNVMPGEYRGCLGCHESHSGAPAGAGLALATARVPRDIVPPRWNDTTVSYTRYVRPVLDRYCAKCHEGQGEARAVLDLTFRPGHLGFDENYWTLIGRPTWGQPYKLPDKPPPGFGIADMLVVEGYGTTDPAAYRTPPPMTRLSYRSRLIELASSGKHYDVRVDRLSLERLICWVDAMCPYKGDEEVRAEADPVFQGVEWLTIRPRLQTAPRLVRPGPVD